MLQINMTVLLMMNVQYASDHNCKNAAVTITVVLMFPYRIASC